MEGLRRFREEREAVEALAIRVEWLHPVEWRVDGKLRLICDADIAVGDSIFQISIRYPSHFPLTPPSAFPRDPSKLLSEHQYLGSGELCLEIGPDNWRPELTGADMLESAQRLFHGEQPEDGRRGRVTSRHATTVGRNLRFTAARLLMTVPLLETCQHLPESVVLAATLRGMYHKEAYVAAVATVTMTDGSVWSDASVPEHLHDEGIDKAAVIVRLPVHLQLPPTTSIADFRAALIDYGIELQSPPSVLIIQGPSFHAYLLWETTGTISSVTVIQPEPSLLRLDKEHAALNSKRVGIIGCGSLGSKVAATLARSGVGKFVLVDDDVLFPGNLVRHDLDWRDVGTHKVDGVARRVQLVNPGAVCAVRRHRLGGQEASESIETLITSLVACDLLVDATAEPRVFNFVSGAATIGKKPVVWGEVFGGGYGGLIARYRPDIEPEPLSIRAAIEQWWSERGVPPERTAHDYGSTGETGPMIADDADVSVIAAHTARLAIDSLIEREPSVYPYSVYMIGLSKGGIFDQPFQTYPVELSPALPTLPVAPLEGAAAVTEIERVLELLRAFKDASNPDS
jgi:molybdopterin/thiamine biosynthesis adenylyltransferase